MKYPKNPRYPGRAQRDKWDAANLAAARIIQAAPEEHHPAFMRHWAATVLDRLAEESLFSPRTALGSVSNETAPSGGRRNL